MTPALITLIILVVAVILFVSELLPMGTTAFLVTLALYLTKVITAKAVFAQLANSNVVLIVAMCVVGQAFFQTGMAYKTGQLITKVAKSEKMLIVTTMLVGGIMSGFLSNTGTVAVLLPIVTGIAVSSNIQPIKLLMPLVFSATIGADISLVGSPGNLIAKTTVETLSKGAMTFTFFEYAKIGIPLLIGSIIFVYLFGHKLIPNREGGSVAVSNLDYSQVPEWKGQLTLAVLVITIMCMVLSESLKFLPPFHIIACIGAVVLIVAGVISEKDAFKSFEMVVVFLLAFMLPLGSALSSTGAGKMIANAVIGVTGSSSPIIIMGALWLLCWGLTQFMSNTAACTLLCPVAYEIANAMGADPRAAVIAVFIGSSVAVCTPLAIPANAMILGPGNVRFKDFIIPGLAVSAVCFVISMILLPIFYPFF